MDLQRQMDLARLSAADLRVGLRKPGLNAETRDFMQQRLCFLTTDAMKIARAPSFKEFYIDWLTNGGFRAQMEVTSD